MLVGFNDRKRRENELITLILFTDHSVLGPILCRGPFILLSGLHNAQKEF